MTFTKNKFQGPEKLGYVKSLDGLRATAVFMVMLLHAHFQFGKNGTMGVDIFFALSGFLITTLLLEENALKNTINLRSFYIRRTFRLFPALYATIFFVLIYTFFFATITVKETIYYEIVSSSLYLSNISWAWGWVKDNIILGHTWSLAVEEQFYLIWPILIVLFLRYLNIVKLICFLILFIPFVWILKYNHYNSIFLSIFHESLFIGCLGALLRWIGKFPNNFSNKVMIFFFILLLIIGVFPINAYKILFENNGRCIVAIMTVFIIIGLVNKPNSLLGKFLSLPFMIYIGKISYALYLWHVPVFRWFLWHSTLPPYLDFIFKFIVTFILAILSLELIEKKSIKIGRNLSDRLIKNELKIEN
jgi:peptidoglycan/LPS O-acetylase OafA/YrhL